MVDNMLQNAARIIRALFEMALRRNWPLMAGRLLKLSKVVEKRLWDWEHPLRQFAFLPSEMLTKIEERGLSVDRLRDMDSKDIGKCSCFFGIFSWIFELLISVWLRAKQLFFFIDRVVRFILDSFCVTSFALSPVVQWQPIQCLESVLLLYW